MSLCLGDGNESAKKITVIVPTSFDNFSRKHLRGYVERTTSSFTQYQDGKMGSVRRTEIIIRAVYLCYSLKKKILHPLAESWLALVRHSLAIIQEKFYSSISLKEARK